MSTALIQFRGAGDFEVRATGRAAKGRELAEKRGANRTANEKLPRQSSRRDRQLVDHRAPRLSSRSTHALGDPVTVTGPIMRALQDMKRIITLIIEAAI
jgi:hypothetical protein